MACYSGEDKGPTKPNSTLECLPLFCYGCGRPHPWALLENSIDVIKCPNAGNPGIAKNARKTVNCIHTKQKKQQHDSKKCKNLAIANYTDFDDAGKERIWQQVLLAVSITSNAAKVSLSIIRVTHGISSVTAGAGCGCGKKHIVFLYDIQVL
jgi:hypothetical protein